MAALFSKKVKVNHLEAREFEKKLSETPNAVLLDVRTEEEHFNSRLPNSILMNMYDEEFAKEIENMDKGKAYFVYCHSGGRSNAVCEHMMKLGFTCIYNLEDGIVSWSGKIEHSN